MSTDPKPIVPRMDGKIPRCGERACPHYLPSSFEQVDPSVCSMTGSPPRGSCSPAIEEMSAENDNLRAEVERERAYRVDSIRQCAIASGAKFVPPERNTDVDVVESAISALRAEVERLRGIADDREKWARTEKAQRRLFESELLPRAKARAEATEAKLAKVREWRGRAKKIENDGWNLTPDDWAPLDAILDAAPDADTKEKR